MILETVDELTPPPPLPLLPPPPGGTGVPLDEGAGAGVVPGGDHQCHCCSTHGCRQS